jgi:peptidoglycan/LPS O-acetylase OafA/YrhL
MRIVASHRYEALDGLRGVAAICVVAGHFGQMLNIYWPANMFLAVDIFFMLSGFVIAHSYGDRLRRDMSGWNYLGRRLARLYPMFIAGLLIGVVGLYIGIRNGATGYRAEDIVQGSLLNAVYLPFLNTARIRGAVGQIFPSDPPAWSLFLEMIASGGFLLMFGLRRNALLAMTVVSFLALLGAGTYFARVQGLSGIDLNMGFDTDSVLGGLPRVAFGFTLGLLLYDLMRDGPSGHIAAAVRRVPYPSFALYLLLFAVLLCPKSIRGTYPFAVLLVFAPTIVFVGACIKTQSGVETQIAKFLGWISYPVYCLHIPIMRIVVFDKLGGNGTSEKVAVAVVATLVATVVLTKWYEEPIRALLSRRLSVPRFAALSSAAPAEGAQQTLRQPLP